LTIRSGNGRGYGGHSINGQRTFAFLHKHLGWPFPG